MAKYIEREMLRKEIDKAQTSLESNDDRVWGRNKPYFKGLAWANRLILDAPTTDVVEVVRCNNCIHSRPLCHTEKKLYNDDCVGCTQISTSYHSVIMSGNDFCSFGVAKMDEKDGADNNAKR